MSNSNAWVRSMLPSFSKWTQASKPKCWLATSAPLRLTDQRIPGVALPGGVGTFADVSLYSRTVVLVGGAPGPGVSVVVMPVLSPLVPQSRCVSHTPSVTVVAPLSQGKPSLVVPWLYPPV